MSGSRTLDSLLSQLEGLLCNEGEYYSHQTALYFLGLCDSPPQILTIVSSKRRRNRNLGNFELVFVYHGKSSNSYLQTIFFREKKLQVSTIEKTFVDLAKDSSYAPSHIELAGLFCSVAYNSRLMLSIARQTSDSVLKRISLFLAWSGRAAYEELPLKQFKRTPVKLDPRIENDLIWNGLFFCKLPEDLLLFPPTEPPLNIERDTRLWMELRALPEFCEKQHKSGMIFIRQTPEPQINQIIESYFVEIFTSLSDEKLDWLLENGLNDEQSPIFPPKLPRLLVSFLTSRSNFLALRKDDISSWVEKNIHNSDLSRVEAAIFFATLIGMEEESVEAFSKLSSSFFYAGKFSIIEFFANHYLGRDYKFSRNVYLDISKTLSVRERYEDALNFLEEAKRKHENDTGEIIGHLFYSTALVLKRLNRFDEALAELFLARQTFSRAKDHESLARTENALGNLYFSLGEPESAKERYQAGAIHAKKAKGKNLLPSFLTNLGLVEYDLGNFSRAQSLLSEGYDLYRTQGNLWNASITGMGLGKIYLKLGHFSKSIKVFREIQTIRAKRENQSGLFEIYSLLAWICELLGKAAAAKTYWQQAKRISQNNRLESRALFVGESLNAMTMIFHKQFSKGINQYSSMLEQAIQQHSSKLRMADCYHGLASALIFSGQEESAKAPLAKALSILDASKSRIQGLQINLLAGLYFPETFPDICAEETMTKIVNSGSFDPFWGFLAHKINETSTETAANYLHHHLSRTPPGLLNHYSKNIKGIDKIVKETKTDTNRSGEFYTLLSPHKTITLHLEDYHIWQKTIPADCLVFDAPAGRLDFQGNSLAIKPGSIPHMVLLQLFLAQPHPIEVPSLYKSAWGCEYDAETDQGAFKTTLQRVKQMLKSICPTTRIIRQNPSENQSSVRLSMAVNWTLAFR